MGIVSISLIVVNMIAVYEAFPINLFPFPFIIINGVLVFGAHKRHDDAILLWITSAIFQATISFALFVQACVFLHYGRAVPELIITVIIQLALMITLIGTIVFASRARQEIKMN